MQCSNAMYFEMKTNKEPYFSILSFISLWEEHCIISLHSGVKKHIVESNSESGKLSRPPTILKLTIRGGLFLNLRVYELSVRKLLAYQEPALAPSKRIHEKIEIQISWHTPFQDERKEWIRRGKQNSTIILLRQAVPNVHFTLHCR